MRQIYFDMQTFTKENLPSEGLALIAEIDHINDVYNAEQLQQANDRVIKQAGKLLKMQEARRKARTASDATNSEDSRTKDSAA